MSILENTALLLKLLYCLVPGLALLATCLLTRLPEGG